MEMEATVLMLNSSATTMTAPVNEQRWALDLFKHHYQEGGLRRLWRGLTGRANTLRCLDEVAQRSGRDLGLQTVPIAAIVGSEGRTGDFDRCFTPLSERTRDRWVSVAVARFRGRPLPPVLLICTGDGYYVRDGHHRISVARALGEEFVEAMVIAWA